MTTLLDTVKADVQEFLRTNQKLMFNERDFQIHLALYLSRSKNQYDDVDVEYYIPAEILPEYKELTAEMLPECKNPDTKNERLYLDIVVAKEGKYVPVELKYKTVHVARQMPRFNQKLKKPIEVLKNQGAQDMGMYNFWKDVRRVELVKRRFKNVVGGLAVFVTNDKAYMNRAASNSAPKSDSESKTESNNVNFSMAEGKHGIHKKWAIPDSACAKTNPGFHVNRKYDIHWETIPVDGIDFHYCILAI